MSSPVRFETPAQRERAQNQCRYREPRKVCEPIPVDRKRAQPYGDRVDCRKRYGRQHVECAADQNCTLGASAAAASTSKYSRARKPNMPASRLAGKLWMAVLKLMTESL